MIKVCIVEDNESIRLSLKILIDGSDGFQIVGVCSNADEALYRIPNWNPDVILMDINLGITSKSGIECIKKLKELGYQGQFLICTVYEDDDRIFEALKAGATGYILKKSSPNEILNSIKELNSGGSPMSSEIARRVVGYFNQSTTLSPKQKDKVISLLTPREQEIINSLSSGLLYKEIADFHHISIDTVRRHVHNIYTKLQVNNRTEAINRIFKLKE